MKKNVNLLMNRGLMKDLYKKKIFTVGVQLQVVSKL